MPHNSKANMARQHPGPAPRNASLQKAAAGWTSGLTFIVLLGLAIEATTGLWIAFAPFSVASQLIVIAHTLGGALLLFPFLVFQIRHYLAWRSQTLSVVKLVGYAATALTLICLTSGAVVTWHALFGRRLSHLWDLTHLVTGLASASVIALHLAVAYAQRRKALSALATFTRRFRLRGSMVAFVVTALYLLIVGFVFSLPKRSPHLSVPEGYSLPDYAQAFDEYRGSPFAPTYARTSTGQLIDPEYLANSASCGTTGCHEQILDEWEPSAHRFSAMNPPFQAVQKSFAEDLSPAETRYCAGCHDPISLFAGAKDIHNMSLSAPGMQEGSSCVVCHSISHVDQRGNADYVLTPPTQYLGEATEGISKRVSDFLIRAYPEQHLADYDRNILRTPEFCGACHKQFIPEALNRFGASPSQNQFDEWRKSHWFVEDKPESSLSCRDCHMRLVSDSTDPGAGEAGDLRRSAADGSHRHHGMIGANFFMSEALDLPHWQEHKRLTEAWLKGETTLPEIEDLYPSGPVASVELLAPPIATKGQELEISAVVRNRKAGHNFITGPLDFLRVWIHLTITDERGNLLAEWGALDPETRAITDQPGSVHYPGQARDSGTFVLEGVPLDAEGEPLLKHELWRKAGGTGNRVIVARYADKQTYQFNIPPDVDGPLTVSAYLNLRRYRQEFLDLVVPNMETETGVLQPTVTMHTTQIEVPIDSQTEQESP